MTKLVFHLFLFGMTTMVIARPSHAQSFYTMNGLIGPKTELPVKLGIESKDQIALASFCESAPDCDGRGRRLGNSCDNTIGNNCDNTIGNNCGNNYGNNCGNGGRNICGNGSGNGCCNGVGNWLDNTQLTFGADSYKSLGDSGLTGFSPLPFSLGNSFGAVSGFNTGVRIGDSRIRGQVGASYGVYDIKGRTTTAPLKDDSLEQQVFMTAGFYKRGDVCGGDRISWGAVYDQFIGHQWGWANNEVQLGQIRGIIGYALNETNEIGNWGTFHINNDAVALGFPPNAVVTNIRAMNQANSYLRHQWAFGGNSMLYAGIVDRADVASWQFGMINLAPVSSSTSLYGNFTYVAPGSATGLVGSSEEQWNASVGMVFYLGKKAVSRTVSGNQGMPLLPVANNGSFLITN